MWSDHFRLWVKRNESYFYVHVLNGWLFIIGNADGRGDIKGKPKSRHIILFTPWYFFYFFQGFDAIVKRLISNKNQLRMLTQSILSVLAQASLDPTVSSHVFVEGLASRKVFKREGCPKVDINLNKYHCFPTPYWLSW